MNQPNCFTNMCRLCLANSAENIDIFGEEGVKNSVQSKILTLFSFLVQPEETLPRKVCEECLKHLNFISAFRINVENAQKTVLLLFSELTKPESDGERQISVMSQNIQTQSQGRENNINLETQKSDMMEPFLISQNQDSTNESDMNNHIKEEDLSEDDSMEVLDSDSDSDNFLPVSGVVEFVKVDDLDGSYSPQESGDEHSDSDDSTYRRCLKRGTRRKKKKIKRSRSNKSKTKEQNETNEEDKELQETTKQPAWTSSMDEEVQNFYQFICEVCNDSQTYRTFNELCKHFRTIHDTEGYFKCCKRKMYCRSHLYQHLILHTRPEMYKCPECDKQLCGPVNLKQHLQVFHLPKTALPFRCSMCGRGFATKTAVENHEKSQHLLSEEEKFVHECDICGKRFASISGVAEHKKRVHAQIRPLLCDICAKAFPNQSRLRKHMTSHSDSENLKCPHCDKRLKNYGRLQVHIKRHQGVIHSCPECEKTYTTRRLLQRHVKTHTDERPHECSICGKRYREKSHLKMHFNQHTGALPFSCQWCPKRFSASGPFYTHRKKMHPEELAKANEMATLTI